MNGEHSMDPHQSIKQLVAFFSDFIDVAHFLLIGELLLLPILSAITLLSLESSVHLFSLSTTSLQVQLCTFIIY